MRASPCSGDCEEITSLVARESQPYRPGVLGRQQRGTLDRRMELATIDDRLAIALLRDHVLVLREPALNQRGGSTRSRECRITWFGVTLMSTVQGSLSFGGVKTRSNTLKAWSDNHVEGRGV